MKRRLFTLIGVTAFVACQNPQASNSDLLVYHTAGTPTTLSSGPIALSPLSDGMAWDINEAGHVVGSSTFGMGGSARAFRWTPDGVDDLGTLGGPSSVAYAINEFDEIAGVSTTATGELHAFLWTPVTGLQDLGIRIATDLSGSGQFRSMDINDWREIVGSYVGPGGTGRAFRVTDYGFQDLGTIVEQSGAPGEPTDGSAAFAINNVGEIVGFSIALVTLTDAAGNPSDPPLVRRAFRPFRWTDHEGMVNLGTAISPIELFLTGPATDVNDFGLVGWSPGLRAEGCCRIQSAAQWTPSSGWTDLFGLRGPFNAESRALGTNNMGFVVGWSEGTDPGLPGLARRPVLWDRDHVIRTLSPTEEILGQANSINDLGQAVGQVVFNQPVQWNIFDARGRVAALANRTTDLINATVVPHAAGRALLGDLRGAEAALAAGDSPAAAQALDDYRERLDDLIAAGRVSARSGGRALTNAASTLIREFTNTP